METELIPGGNIQPLYERAKFSKRLLAFLADGFLINTTLQLVYLAVFEGIKAAQTISNLLFYVLFALLLFVGYYCYFAYKNNGQTLGKQWFHIRIANMQGENLSLIHFIGREFVKSGMIVVMTCIFNEYVALLWLATYLTALSWDRRALHDIIVQTQVINAVEPEENMPASTYRKQTQMFVPSPQTFFKMLLFISIPVVLIFIVAYLAVHLI